MRKFFTILAVLSLMVSPIQAQNNFLQGDVNGDGDIDISDVVTLVNLILNGGSYLYCPDNHHPHLIDLGLPSGTKWACCNVGASSPEEYGGYYAWGETIEKQMYDSSTYIHYDSSSGTFHDIGSDISGTQYDVAHVKWGGGWRMPTITQTLELVYNTTSEWTSENGVEGIKFTGNNGGTIFLPAAGCTWFSDLYYAGSGGRYWSSALDEYHEDLAYYLYFNLYFNDGTTTLPTPHGDKGYRRYGLSVRPVR